MTYPDRERDLSKGRQKRDFIAARVCFQTVEHNTFRRDRLGTTWSSMTFTSVEEELDPGDGAASLIEYLP
jgi:hypothetical protein